MSARQPMAVFVSKTSTSRSLAGHTVGHAEAEVCVDENLAIDDEDNTVESNSGEDGMGVEDTRSSEADGDNYGFGAEETDDNELSGNESERTDDEGQAQAAYSQNHDYSETEDLSACSDSSADADESDGEEEATDPEIIEEMECFKQTFRGIGRHFRFINKIGEGTFSSVYKAEDLYYDRYENPWDIHTDDGRCQSLPPNKKRRTQEDFVAGSEDSRRPKFVAIKKIYVTSSPARIQNELELLHDLSGCDTVVPLITAFRHNDQVVAILPYFKHVDFREYFRQLTIPDVRLYFRSLFSALAHVHARNIIHRDIKPTNFLYDFYKGRGVLVDFGLAEREGVESPVCSCQTPSQERKDSRTMAPSTPSQGYPKNDSRPSRRANRAGTRGFRAPEVLFKCTSQTTKIDIWSAGVILLTILSKRFPFFNSSDDVDALIEIATIFGKQRMRQCASLHGCIFETTIPTIGEKGFTLEKIVLWATNRTTSGSSSSRDDDKLPGDEALAVKFMQRCFDLNPSSRISAEEALRHEFLAC